MKPTSRGNSWIVLFVFLAACGRQTIVLPTETPVSIAASATPVPTFIPVTIIPSPIPTQPTIPVITPDTIQVERWKEYEVALAKSLLSFLSPEEVLCEWEILGQSVQEVYAWAVCNGGDSTGSIPVVIHLETDGTIQSVERPKNWSADIPRMFPADIQAKFEIYQFGTAKEMSEHIIWRRTHPGEPPLIVLSVTPLP